LSLERWASFTLDQQLLMIGNEMNRASKLMAPSDRDRLRLTYERALFQTDLTIRLHERRGLRRELLRWRDLLAELYVQGESAPQAHCAAFRALLRFTPQTAKQIPHVLEQQPSN
jgi:hypothetical protein